MFGPQHKDLACDALVTVKCSSIIAHSHSQALRHQSPKGKSDDGAPDPRLSKLLSPSITSCILEETDIEGANLLLNAGRHDKDKNLIDQHGQLPTACWKHPLSGLYYFQLPRLHSLWENKRHTGYIYFRPFSSSF